MFKKKEREIVTEIKENYITRESLHKESALKRLNKYLKLLSFKNLNYTIQNYGYNYSFGRYMASIVILMAGIVASGYIFKLEFQTIVWLGFFAILLLPIIILSQIRFLHNNYRFEQMATYLQEMITVFKVNPKILYSLKEVQDLYTSPKGMKSTIQKSIDYIEHNSEANDDFYKRALDLIEEDYPCTRVHSLHSLMLTVENQNSVNYHDAINDLYEDIQAWISRVYDYQIELKNVKAQFTMVLLLTIGVASAMVNILPPTLITFIDNPVYQVSTAGMLAIFLAMFCFIQSKLNGQWLVNDIDKDDEKILKSINYVENFDEKKSKKQSIIKAVIVTLVPLYGLYIGNNNLVVIGGLAAVLMYFWDTIQYRSHFKHIEKELQKQFPIWLRDVSLNMHNLVVTRAIKQSYPNAPAVLKYYLKDFINELEEDPVTIRPYANFLKKFYINDITSAMKSLYSIKQQNETNASKQISDLIVKNQSMMEKGERIRNENQLIGMNMMGTLPMIVGSLKLIVDMVLLIIDFMSMTSM